VADEAQRPADQAGLFSDLAKSGLLEGLTLFEFSLGEGPVLMHRAMHDGNVEASIEASDDEATRRLDDICG
jgi:hypothetical protein